MYRKLVLVLCFVFSSTSLFAVDPEPPPGYTPWFSVSLTNPTEDTVSLSGAPTSFPEWYAIKVVVAASGTVRASPPSDPSDEYLILPPNYNPPNDWLGPTIQKADTWNVVFTKSSGNVTGYIVFYKLRRVYRACRKPGKPALSN